MRYVKELSNRNRMVSESTCEANRAEQHAAYTIKFVFRGAEDCELNNRKMRIYPDSFVLIKAGSKVKSSINSLEPVDTFSISFEQRFIDSFVLQHQMSGGIDTSHLEDSFNESLYPISSDMLLTVKHLKRALESGSEDEIVINEGMKQALINYLKIHDSEYIQKIDKLSFIKSKTREDVLRRLIVAKEFISSFFNQNITLEDIAEHACLSVNHLLRTFKEAYDISPYQYLMQVRLNRAKELLKTTSYSLNEVVMMVGFGCPSSFIRLFKSTFNTTPLKYKKMHLN
ncbi:helix-turn-helix transcriptional regulator [Pedobacter sp. MW01-1-1]|uniref:helix-turn-helix transcriptional regulator n=1 Tax=Pedobacter sp. MW01-1-1 TaxID=3383027 RepID=UPI003FEE7D22